ncbi:MAG TPA: vWA domain-containing protein [Gemmataceae bacterium]|nr:vWA domain-containing protein [Gemmataceae bacterium]
MRTPQRRGLALVAWLALLAAGCGDAPQSPSGPRPQSQPTKAPAPAYHIDLPKAEAKPGTAVVILVDTSGSMAQPVPDAKGKQRPKNEIARDALVGIVGYTADWKKGHANASLQLAIFNFSSRVNPVLPMGDFDADKARAALGKIPAPNGGTAIGLAVEEGYKALYRSGCSRKFIVCVTDGENTSGPGPDIVAPRLHEQTQGAVQLNFVAFDTRASQFKFLAPINGHVVEAADGGKLQAELTTIYEKRILAEAPDDSGK